MSEVCKISKLTGRSEHHLSVYQHCLSTIICSPSQANYFFCHCCEYPRPTNLESIFEDVFIDNSIENIVFSSGYQQTGVN
jgi:hypothetical protein